MESWMRLLLLICDGGLIRQKWFRKIPGWRMLALQTIITQLPRATYFGNQYWLILRIYLLNTYRKASLI